jgi:hypothetical protein
MQITSHWDILESKVLAKIAECQLKDGKAILKIMKEEQ